MAHGSRAATAGNLRQRLCVRCRDAAACCGLCRADTTPWLCLPGHNSEAELLWPGRYAAGILL